MGVVPEAEISLLYVKALLSEDETVVPEASIGWVLVLEGKMLVGRMLVMETTVEERLVGRIFVLEGSLPEVEGSLTRLNVKKLWTWKSILTCLSCLLR